MNRIGGKTSRVGLVYYPLRDTHTAYMEKGLSHANYNRIFSEPVIDEIAVEHLRLTELNVPTGELVISDPLAFPDFPPLKRKVRPGKYPVDLYLAQTPVFGQRVAIAVLTFSDGVATRYELALRDGEDIDKLEYARGFFGFPVDAGLGSFCDQETSRLYNEFIDQFSADNPDSNIYDFLAERFKQNARRPEDPRDAGDWLDFHIPVSPSHNVAMFQSGYGDGVYPAYWGIDAQGNIVNLVIDFHVLLLPD